MRRLAIFLFTTVVSLATIGATPHTKPAVVKSVVEESASVASAGKEASPAKSSEKTSLSAAASSKKSASSEGSVRKASSSKASAKKSSAGESAAKESIARLILAGARKEVEKGTEYRGHGYYEIPYPGGDISPEIGVCTDLLVRAFRNAGLDLQKLVHEDRSKNPRDYPTYLWEVKKADSNIDHRRCQNLCMFFKKFARKCPDGFAGDKINEWQGGDVVFFKWEYEKFPWHCAIVSDARTPDGFPMIVHLFPDNAKEESIEKYLPIHSHYRWERQ